MRDIVFASCLFVYAVTALVFPGPVGAARFQLDWHDNSNDEDGFNIQRKVGVSGTFSRLARVGANVTSFVDTSLADATTYCYRVTAFNSLGESASTNEVCGTTPASSTTSPPAPQAPPPAGNLSATLLDLTGEDIVGVDTETPDGIADVHIAVSGVPATINRVIITNSDGGIWEGPFNGKNWIVAIRPQTNPSTVDLYFKLWLPSPSYTVTLSFADGTTRTVQASGGATTAPPPTPVPIPTPVPAPAPAPSPSTVAAVLLGQTGEDIAGRFSEAPNGVKDVHIVVSGVPATVIRASVRNADGGIWEGPFNGLNWIVAIRPRANSSVVDLHFDFWQPSSSYTLTLSFANGTRRTIETAAVLGGPVAAPADQAQAPPSPSVNQPQIARMGVFRPETGEWFLDRNGNGQWDGCAVDLCIASFGEAGDRPVVGNWSGGINKNIGTFNPATGTWHLDGNGNNRWDGCAVDICIVSFGQPGDLPVTIKRSGMAGEVIGVYRETGGLWRIDMNGNNQFDGCSTDRCGAFGTFGDLPLAGDWQGLGTEAIGVFRPNSGDWFLDANDNGQWDGCAIDRCFLRGFGDAATLPVVGDWDGTGKVRVGIFRPATGEWLLDINGNGAFDGCGVDACLGPFGQSGDLPVTGNW